MRVQGEAEQIETRRRQSEAHRRDAESRLAAADAEA
jgi:hypothetical protein